MKSRFLSILIFMVIMSLSLLISASCAEADEPMPAEEEQIEETAEKTAEEAEEPVDIETPIAGDILIDGVIGEEEYSYHMYNGGAGMDLYYSYDDQYLYMGIECKAYGWIAIGFGPEFAMQGADIIFMRFDDGKVVMRDDFGTDAFTHASDESLGGSFDIIEYSGTAAGNDTTFEFKKPMDSGDEFDKVLSPGTLYRIILAANEKTSDFDSEHTIRFMSQMQF